MIYKYTCTRSEKAVSGNLEAPNLKIFLARRQPWWRLVRFGPPNIRNIPTPLKAMWEKQSTVYFLIDLIYL